MMKIWLTARFDDDGIREIETVADPVGDVFSHLDGHIHWTYLNWYQEGETWHRTKKSAVAAAKKWRDLRIANAQHEAVRLAALPTP